jgi:hypothetical protein
MTLILTAMTPRFIVQVSDRRLTWDSGRFRDGFVKAVVTRGFACSYTGIASLDGDTAKWIAKRLAAHDSDPDGGLQAVMNAAAAACRASRYAKRPLAILAVGWHMQGPLVTPSTTLISNFHPTGKVGAFMRGQLTIGSGRVSTVVPVGALIREDELRPASRAVERLCIQRRETARAIAQILTECIRGVSRASSRTYDQRDPAVSEDVLVVALPRPDLCRGGLVVGQLVDDWWSVTSIPAGESRKERQGGPIIVGSGAAIRALEPDEGPPGKGGVAGALEIIARGGTGDEGRLAVYILTDPPLGAAWGWPGSAPPGLAPSA